MYIYAGCKQSGVAESIGIITLQNMHTDQITFT